MAKFLRDLVRREKQALNSLLIEGLNSGEAEPLDMSRVRAKAHAKLKKEVRTT